MKTNVIICLSFLFVSFINAFNNGTYLFSGDQTICSKLYFLKRNILAEYDQVQCLAKEYATQQLAVTESFIRWSVTGSCSSNCTLVCAQFSNEEGYTLFTSSNFVTIFDGFNYTQVFPFYSLIDLLGW